MTTWNSRENRSFFTINHDSSFFHILNQKYATK